MVNEIEASYRVYVKEWLLDYVSVEVQPVEEMIKKRFEGRLRPEDIKITVMSSGSYAGYVHRWNVNSEWKTEELADTWAKALREMKGKQFVEVVARNSKAEHGLINYGTVLLLT